MRLTRKKTCTPKKKVTIFFALLTVLLLASYVFFVQGKECSTQIKNTPYIFVVTAFDVETEPFLNNSKEVYACNTLGITYHLMSHKEKEYMLYESGIGTDNAYASTKDTLENFTASKLLFSGIAGSTDEGYSVGDTRVARTWLNLETNEIVSVDTNLVESVGEISGVEIVELGATSKLFVRDKKAIPPGVSLVDMETFEIAFLAHGHNVPFVAFRTISDHADGKETGENFELGANISAKKVLTYISTQ